jgi:cell division protein FtsZ
MVFITAGMGGGTGTGAAPVIARIARERNILTVGVVTKPFGFEGTRRARMADEGIAKLQQHVDTLIVIPNQNLFRVADERTTWKDAFKMADQVLYMGVRGVTDLMMVHGLINLDFADIKAVMAEMGKAMMGTGEAEGENRAIRAAEAAISNPLLEDTSMAGARGLLINITGGEDMTLFEVDQSANRIREEVDEDANVIFGSAVDETLAGRIRVSVVATGIDSPKIEAQRPRLVAVGSGAPAPQPIQAPAPVQTMTPAPMPLHAVGAGALRQPSAAPLEAVAMQEVGAESQAMQYQPQPAPTALRQPAAPQPQPIPRPGLFQDPSRPFVAPAGQGPMGGTQLESRQSLFSTVTGAFRRRPLTGGAPGQEGMERREPAIGEGQPEAPRPSVRPAQPAPEVGLEIPAFLRRQSS